MPENDTELFLDSNAMALSELKINGQGKTDNKYFQKNRICLLAAEVKEGWNEVSMKYFAPYTKTQTGLH